MSESGPQRPSIRISPLGVFRFEIFAIAIREMTGVNVGMMENGMCAGLGLAEVWPLPVLVVALVKQFTGETEGWSGGRHPVCEIYENVPYNRLFGGSSDGWDIKEEVMLDQPYGKRGVKECLQGGAEQYLKNHTAALVRPDSVEMIER